MVIKEMSLFETTKWSNNLEKLYHDLLTNRPTPVEPERAISATGLFVKKTQKQTG